MHLLYVDDDRINLMLFEAACAALAGVRVSTAANGTEALELARRFSSEESVAFINGVLDAIIKRAQ